MSTPLIHRIPGELDPKRAQEFAERYAGNPFIRSAGWGAVQFALDIIGKEFGQQVTVADLIVEQHVHCNVSVLVKTMANNDYEHGADSLGTLMDKAEDLSTGAPNYEVAARAAGWDYGSQIFRVEGDDILVADSWQDACEQDEIEVEGPEIEEFWAVTRWLALMLESYGEKVDTRFGGLHVWARTTKGLPLSQDEAIQKVARGISAPPEPPAKA